MSRSTTLIIVLILQAAGLDAAAKGPDVGHLEELVRKAAKIEGSQCEAVLKKKNLSLVIGVVTPDGETITSFGAPLSSAKDARFKIASLSKPFTGSLVRQLAREGKVSLDAPLMRYLPEAHLPSHKKITIRQLIEHTSGLPAVSPGLDDRNPSDPYDGYTAETLFPTLKKVNFDPSDKPNFRYSNFGYALLTALIEKIEKKSYQEVLKEKILKPLKMNATGTRYSDEEIVPGHLPNGNKVPGWHLRGLYEGGGGVQSTTSDLMKFLSAKLKERPEDLDAWRSNEDKTRFWHGGTIEGFSSFMGIDLKSQSAIVVLVNGHAINPDGAGHSTHCLDDIVGTFLENRKNQMLIRKAQSLPDLNRTPAVKCD